MRKSLFVLVFAVFIGVLYGCGKQETQAVTTPTAPPPKGSLPDVIKSNPNIPESAKQAILGNKGAPKAP